MNPVEPIKTYQYETLPVAVYESNEAMGRAAALDAREIIKQAIADYKDKNGKS